MRPRIALVGLGNMGRAAAERLLDAGYEVAVHNRTAARDGELLERGATSLDSPAAAFEVAELCLLTLANDAAVEAIADAVMSRAREGSTLIDLSTISVAASARVAEQVRERGVAYLRAPVSGNPQAVRAGTAAIFVSGPAEALERCDPVLRAIAPNVRYVGEGETARVLKLVLQIMIGGTAELLAEAIVLGESAGLDRRLLLETIGASVVGSTFVEYKTGPLLADDFSATFSTAMMQKDVGLVLDLAGANDVELPLIADLQSLLDSACENGLAEHDFASLLLELQRRAKGD